MLLIEAKAHLRLDGDDEDNLIGALIAAARVAVETEIRRVLIAQSWRAITEGWPADGVTLPIQPALSVETLRAIGSSGATTELSADDFEFDAADFSVTLDPVSGAVRYEIDFTAGTPWGRCRSRSGRRSGCSSRTGTRIGRRWCSATMRRRRRSVTASLSHPSGGWRCAEPARRKRGGGAPAAPGA